MENRWLLLSVITAFTIFQCNAAPDSSWFNVGDFFNSNVQTPQSSLADVDDHDFDTTTKVDNSELVESDLFDDLLFTAYKKEVRPGTINHPVVHVNHWLSITAVNLKKTNWLEIDGWETIEWTDPRLIWDPQEFNGLKVISLDHDSIWVPDIILWTGTSQNSGHVHNNIKARVSSHGHVYYAPMVHHVIRCVPKGEVFNCIMMYGSWVYDGTQLILNKTRDHVDTSFYNADSDFTIISTSAEVHTSVAECCPGVYYDVTYNITLKWKDSDSFDGLAPHGENGGYVAHKVDETNKTTEKSVTESDDTAMGTDSTSMSNNSQSYDTTTESQAKQPESGKDHTSV